MPKYSIRVENNTPSRDEIFIRFLNLVYEGVLFIERGLEKKTC